jgi:hypothetical protein
MAACGIDPLESETLPFKVPSVNCACPGRQTNSSIGRKNNDRAQLILQATLCMYGSPQSSAVAEKKKWDNHIP